MYVQTHTHIRMKSSFYPRVMWHYSGPLSSYIKPSLSCFFKNTFLSDITISKFLFQIYMALQEKLAVLNPWTSSGQQSQNQNYVCNTKIHLSFTLGWNAHAWSKTKLQVSPWESTLWHQTILSSFCSLYKYSKKCFKNSIPVKNFPNTVLKIIHCIQSQPLQSF